MLGASVKSSPGNVMQALIQNKANQSSPLNYNQGFFDQGEVQSYTRQTMITALGFTYTIE